MVDWLAMSFLLFAVGAALTMFCASLLLMEWGLSLGMRRIARQGMGSMSGLGPIEGAVFALMGLLLAFTLSGALMRFDERRQLILKEANAVITAQMRFDLLGEDATPLKAKLRQYVAARLALYQLPIDFSITEGVAFYSQEERRQIAALEAELWNATLEVLRKPENLSARNLVVPPLTALFEVAELRAGVNEHHPPKVIYVMLYGLGLGVSLLGGFGMAASSARSWVHMVTFAAAISVALYVITDLEFPRLGLIRLDHADHFLKEILQNPN